MGFRGPKPSPLMLHVVGLYRRGTLATLQEGAAIAGVSRQRILVLLRAAGVDWQRERLRFIARARRHAVMVSEGRVVRRPSKLELRLRAQQAKAAWDKRNGQTQLDAQQQSASHGDTWERTSGPERQDG